MSWELINLVLFGTCGVLDEDIKETSIIIPSHALRDEGTSFHYVEASDEIAVNVGVLDHFRSYLNERQISHKEGKVWTTDGVYRETNGKLKARKAAGSHLCGYGVFCCCSFSKV